MTDWYCQCGKTFRSAAAEAQHRHNFPAMCKKPKKKEFRLWWKVGDAPVGRYRSFDHRSWPSAYFDKKHDLAAAYLSCEDSYAPWRVREGKHGPIIIRVADWNVSKERHGAFEWRRLKKEAKTLEEAKEIVLDFWKKNPIKMPEEMRS